VRYTVPPTATADRVLADLAEVGAHQLLRVVDAIAGGSAQGTPQSGEPSHAAKLTAEDGRLDWATPAAAVFARWRGTTPEPGAFTTVDGARLKVLELRETDAAAPLPPGHLRGDGATVLVGTATVPLALVRVQPAGKSAMAAGDWWRGLRTDTPVAGS
jgi:methionyl-tRNA formyltransferase